jgi:hypothetical protein
MKLISTYTIEEALIPVYIIFANLYLTNTKRNVMKHSEEADAANLKDAKILETNGAEERKENFNGLAVGFHGRELIPPASAKDPVRSGESKATVSRERTVYQTRAINFEYGTDTNPWEKYSDIRRKLEGR